MSQTLFAKGPKAWKYHVCHITVFKNGTMSFVEYKSAHGPLDVGTLGSLLRLNVFSGQQQSNLHVQEEALIELEYLVGRCQTP